MKKVLLLCMAALLLCAVLTACGTDGVKDGTTATTTTTTRDDGTTTTTERRMDDMLRDNGETVSEMISENFSELHDRSFLDPQNGIVSDTAPN
ncbi:MAG: hypothetical protein IJT44_13470 [Clostridia bacterium]|nr:hypothetical protein [Clostridia bacterium]